jgi:hypothetical protein
VGPPGIGKSNTIKAAGKFLRKLPEFKIAPTSTTGASLVDALAAAKKTITHHPDPQIEYNSMLLLPDELGALLNDYDNSLVANLTTFYDVTVPYSQTRRGAGINISISNPQLSILAGDTTSHLHDLLPDGAWDQGFMSRTILIYADDHPMVDDIFNVPQKDLSEELMHDLKCIYTLQGQFAIDEEYRNRLNAWRKAGLPPAPTHPKLRHYNSRRLAHFLKLSMVSSADRSDSLKITLQDYDRAFSWLTEAEALMPYVFSARVNVDSRVMDEIAHFIKGKEVVETKVVRFACERVPTYAVGKMLDLMVSSGMIKITKVDRQGLRYFTALA